VAVKTQKKAGDRQIMRKKNARRITNGMSRAVLRMRLFLKLDL
jgi:hypothetical protein